MPLDVGFQAKLGGAPSTLGGQRNPLGDYGACRSRAGPGACIAGLPLKLGGAPSMPAGHCMPVDSARQCHALQVLS